MSRNVTFFALKVAAAAIVIWCVIILALAL
jgi:hypothetical protein